MSVVPIAVKCVKNEAGLSLDLHLTRGRDLAQLVPGPAGVGAIVLGVGVENVESNKSKIVRCSETMALRDGFAIAKPFNLRPRKLF